MRQRIWCTKFAFSSAYSGAHLMGIFYFLNLQIQGLINDLEKIVHACDRHTWMCGRGTQEGGFRPRSRDGINFLLADRARSPRTAEVRLQRLRRAGEGEEKMQQDITAG
jgi:hypothetical protein